MATAGSVIVDLLLKTGSFTTDAARAEKSLQNLQKTASSAATGIGKAFAGIAAGVVAGLSIGSAVSSFVQGVNTAIDHADKLGDMSEKFGLSTEKLSAWGYAAKMSGTDLTTLTGTLPRFSKAVADAADSSSKAGRTFRPWASRSRTRPGTCAAWNPCCRRWPTGSRIYRTAPQRPRWRCSCSGRAGPS